MSTRSLKIGILGCGSAGPAAALLLARAGHSVDLFERAPALGPVGTGFILQPTGLGVLEALGLRDEAETHGARLVGLRAQRPDGRSILDLAYARLAPDVYGLGMHRATMLAILVGAFPGSGVRLHLDHEILSSRIDGPQRWLASVRGEHGPFDLVIVANGARSRERAWTATGRRVVEYPWGAYWAIVPDPERIFADRLHQVVNGTQTMLGLLPTGARIDDAEKTPLVSVFWSTRKDRVEAIRAEGAERLRGQILALEPRAAPLVAGLSSMDQWSFAEYLDVVMRPWHAPGVVVLGDAAHAMSPQLGQGVNLALFDAQVLAESISQAETLAAGLAGYSRARRRHLGFYQFATRWLTPFFQSDRRLAGGARDAVLPLLGRTKFFDRQMIATMAGYKTGPLSTLPGQPPPS